MAKETRRRAITRACSVRALQLQVSRKRSILEKLLYSSSMECRYSCYGYSVNRS